MKAQRAYVVLVALTMVTCNKSNEAFIVLNVDSGNAATKSMISSLQVTVGDITRDFDVSRALPATLGIETSKTGTLGISVVGIGSKPLGKWSGSITVARGQTIERDVVLSCDGLDCGTSVSVDAGVDNTDAKPSFDSDAARAGDLSIDSTADVAPDLCAARDPLTWLQVAVPTQYTCSFPIGGTVFTSGRPGRVSHWSCSPAQEIGPESYAAIAAAPGIPVTVSMSFTVTKGSVDFMVLDLDVTNACIISSAPLADGTVQNHEYWFPPDTVGSGACVTSQLGLTPVLDINGQALPNPTISFTVPGGHTYLVVYDGTVASATATTLWEADYSVLSCSPDKRVTYTSVKGCPMSPATVLEGATTAQVPFTCDSTFDTQGTPLTGSCTPGEAGKGQCDTHSSGPQLLEFCPTDGSGPRTFDCPGQCLDWQGTVGCVSWH